MTAKDGFTYYNPVKIEFGEGVLNKLPKIIGDRKTLVVTSKSNAKNPVFQSLNKHAQSSIVHLIDDVTPNPTFRTIGAYLSTMRNMEIDLIVGYGGGSVLDTAKALSLYKNDTDVVEALIKGNQDQTYVRKPFILVPTTAGSGSEVTPWATVWDDVNQKKFSLHLPDLWAERAICDPRTQLSLPLDFTIQSGLDALSHSLESVWNVNSNPISEHYASMAVARIFEFLPKLLSDPENIEYRSQLLFASLNAGLAFSNTRTAMAHAISYYLTLEKGTPHGIASSAPLPLIVEFIEAEETEMAEKLEQLFSKDLHTRLLNLFRICSVSPDLSTYSLEKFDFQQIKEQVLENQRAKNFFSLSKFTEYWSKKWGLQY